MHRTFKHTLAAGGAAALVAMALLPQTSQHGNVAHGSSVVVRPAAFSTSGAPVSITAAERQQGVTDGVAFSNALATVTVLSDDAHRARKITVTTQYKGLTVKLKSRASYNYTCSARQQVCTPDRPYAWSWLQFANAEGTTTVRLNPSLGASIPQVVNDEGKPSFVIAGKRITARMVLTDDGRVTYVKALETNKGAGYWKFFLRGGGTTTLASDKTAGFEMPVNAYKIEEIDKSTGTPMLASTVWLEDVMGLAAQQAAG